MANKNREKQLAKEYYMHGILSQREIAKIVGVSEKSLSQWVNDDKWDSERDKMQLSKNKLAEHMYSTSIKFMKQLENAEEVKLGDIDAITKIASAIDKVAGKGSAPNVIEVMSEFIKFISNTDSDLAQKVIPIAQTFVKTKL